MTQNLSYHPRVILTRPSQFLTMTEDAALIKLPNLEDKRILGQLGSLTRGESSAVVIDDFTTDDCCNTIAGAVSAQPMGRYAIEPSFQRRDLTLFEAKGDIKRYSATGLANQQDLRNMVKPLALPTDQAQVILDEMWSPGVNRLRLDGMVAPFGIPRRILAGGSTGPHLDLSHEDHPDSQLIKAWGTLGLIIYLTDSTGGDLVVYGVGADDECSNQRLRDPTHPYALDRKLLGPERARIKPKRGRLVLFNVRFAHEVEPLAQGSNPRVSLSAFCCSMALMPQ